MTTLALPSRSLSLPRVEFPAWLRHGLRDERAAMAQISAGGIYGGLNAGAVGVAQGAAGITYLLRDEFTTDASAPLASPRTCEPGPGTAIIDDVNAQMSISGSALHWNKSVDGWNTLWISQSTFSRVCGRAFAAKLKFASGTPYLMFGFTVGGFAYADMVAAFGFGTGNLYQGNYQGSGDYGLTFVGGTTYDCLVVLRASGYFAMIQVGGTWKLFGVSHVSNASNLYLFAGGYYKNILCEVRSLRLADFSGVWSTDYGIATNRVASPTSPTATASTANAIIEFTWTPAAGETLELDTRRTDADNRWIVRCSQSGGTIKLIERNAATETERSSVAQTWTAGTAYRIVVIQDADTIKTYVANVAKNSYASASFNNTATGVNVAGFATGSNLVCYPRDVSAYIPAGL